MGGSFHEPPYPPLQAHDFGPGKAYRVVLHNGGGTVTIGDPADQGVQKTPALVQPAAGTVDVAIHGLPGRFIEKVMGTWEIPVDVVSQLLQSVGIAPGTPLRVLTCHGAEPPLNGPAVAQRLASLWGGPVLGANGTVLVSRYLIRVHLVEWEPAPMGGMRPIVTGYDQGAWVTHSP